jgi:hypothetical protein
MSQHAKQLDKRRKVDKTEKKKSYRSECPVNVDSHFPVLTFQIFTVPSQLPLPSDSPSGLQATDVTLRWKCHESAHEATQAGEEN